MKTILFPLERIPWGAFYERSFYWSDGPALTITGSTNGATTLLQPDTEPCLVAGDDVFVLLKHDPLDKHYALTGPFNVNAIIDTTTPDSFRINFDSTSCPLDYVGEVYKLVDVSGFTFYGKVYGSNIVSKSAPAKVNTVQGSSVVELVGTGGDIVKPGDFFTIPNTNISGAEVLAVSVGGFNECKGGKQIYHVVLDQAVTSTNNDFMWFSSGPDFATASENEELNFSVNKDDALRQITMSLNTEQLDPDARYSYRIIASDGNTETLAMYGNLSFTHPY